MKTGYHFFLKHAGYSYDPKTETPLQGRRRCALMLAEAERVARNNGCSFSWCLDTETTSADWIDANEDGGANNDPWQTWVCVMRDSNGRIVQSLGGIDFGRNGEPWGDPCRRVVEAELAAEQCGG